MRNVQAWRLVRLKCTAFLMSIPSTPVPWSCRHSLRLHIYVYLVQTLYNNLLIYVCSVNLQSFADQWCSGKKLCSKNVYEIVGYSKPCPLELSSYLEAAFICVPGNLMYNSSNFIKYLFCYICKVLQMLGVQGCLDVSSMSMSW